MTGTGTNMIFAGQATKYAFYFASLLFSCNFSIPSLDGSKISTLIFIFIFRLFPKSGGISYAAWFGFAFPLMVVLLLVGWVYLLVLFLGTK